MREILEEGNISLCKIGTANNLVDVDKSCHWDQVSTLFRLDSIKLSFEKVFGRWWCNLAGSVHMCMMKMINEQLTSRQCGELLIFGS